MVKRIPFVTVMRGYTKPVSTELTSAQDRQMKSIGRLQQNGNKFELYVQLMDSYTTSLIFQLAESIPSNRLHGMFGFHNRMLSRFSVVAFLRGPL